MEFNSDFLQALDKKHKLALCGALLIPPPVSLNTVIEVSYLSPVLALNFMEKLCDIKVMRPIKTGDLGFYKVRDPGLIQPLIQLFDRSELIDIMNYLLKWANAADYKEFQKSLIITNIISEIGYLDDALVQHVMAAAKYCLDSGNLEAATVYYNNLYKYLSYNGKDEKLIVDAVLGIISASGHIQPLEKQASMLLDAREKAVHCRDDERRCLVNLRIAQVYKFTGDYDRASVFYKEAWALAQGLGRSDLLREAALFTSDFLFWKGLIGDAIARYEEVLGDIERFPADQATLRAAATLGWCYGINGQTARGAALIDVVRNRAIDLKMPEVKIYSDFMSVLIFLEARRMEEAERYLNEILASPEEITGNFTLRGGYAAKAFLLCKKGEYQESYKYQIKAYQKSLETGWRHHRGAYTYDFMDILESQGFFIPNSEWNYDSEMIRLSEWPDVYMRGVGLRYQAQRALKKGASLDGIMADLSKSIELLSLAGANLELAHTRLLLARLELQQGKDKTAIPLLREAWKTFASVNPDIFPIELRPFIEEEPSDDFFINTLSEVIKTIGTVRDRNRILERIINLLIKLTFAGRGGFYLIQQEGRITLAASRNLEDPVFESPTHQKIHDMVLEVAHQKKQIVHVSDTESGWALCYPIMLGDDILGVLYLDNTLVGLTPPTKTLSLLSLIGTQVAIAIDNANAYQQIEHLKDKLEDETNLYRREIKSDESMKIIGVSDPFKNVMRKVQKISATATTVLITGETGVGKELIAKTIHLGSHNSEFPFIPVNASSLDPNLIASELFGHEKGAFTGATGLRRGRFELADGGTLFLDEIDSISLEVQAKLLRAIQEKEFERVGGTKTIKSNFRLIAATNQDLKKLVKNGSFREDLFYRINVFPLHIPPLRERPEDIPHLVEYFLGVYNKKLSKKIRFITAKDRENLKTYPWPGNVRELRHVVERAVILSDGDTLLLPDLKEVYEMTGISENLPTLTQLERTHIIKTLNLCKWKVSGRGGAAEMLDIKAPTLFARMRKLGIQKNFA